MKKHVDLRILLLQTRESPVVRVEEHESFARHSGLNLRQIDILNAFDTPDFLPEVITGYDALFVGGASEASVLDPDQYPFVNNAQTLLRHCLKEEIPVFASCFGFQLAVLALGGHIIQDEADFEMGTIPIELTAASASDPLFHDTPEGFLAVSVHRERAVSAPPGCQTLAITPGCCHAFCVPGKPFWAFQFHPEVDYDTLVDRLTRYKARYTGGDEHLNQVLETASKTPESNILLEKFVQRVLLNSPEPDNGCNRHHHHE